MTARSEAVAPKTAAEAGEILARCNSTGEKVSIVGGATLSGMGFPPERLDISLSTQRLSGIVANERADLTIAVRAGTPIQNVTALLSTQGQFIPFDAPRPQYATVGGTLAAGWLGPRRHLYGRVRDYLIGSTIVLADGTIARAGGMVVKNVSGYDMSRLYVGSFGTLGVIVQANFKTVPLPKQARLFLARLPERTRTRACAQLAAAPMRPAAAFWIDGFHNAVDGDDGRRGASPFCSRAVRHCSSARRASCARRWDAPASRRRACSTPARGNHFNALSMRTSHAWANARSPIVSLRYRKHPSHTRCAPTNLRVASSCARTRSSTCSTAISSCA